MLVADRFCPRCSVSTASDDGNYRPLVTRWTNEHDHGPDLACTGCGLRAASPLTDDERRRLIQYEQRPVKTLRRRYLTV